MKSQYYLLLLFQFFKFETTIKITILLLQFVPILSTIIKLLTKLFSNLPFIFGKFLKHKSTSLLYQTLKDSSLIFFIFTTLPIIFYNIPYWSIYSNNLRSSGFKRLWSQCQRTTTLSRYRIAPILSTSFELHAR